MTEDIDDIETPTEKTFVRSVRLTPSAWREAQARAERAGMLVNSYVVWAISRAPERADIRDVDAPLALSDGETTAVVGSGADVQDAAAAVVEDDGDWVLGQAEKTAGDLYIGANSGFPAPDDSDAIPQPETPLPDDVVWWPECGHPNIPENRTKRGPGRPDACRICRNAATRASRQRVKERADASTAGEDRGPARTG